MATFKRAFRGYNVKEVNAFMQAAEVKTDAEKETLKKRIQLLEEEIRELNARLTIADNKERQLVDGLYRIQQMEDEAKEKIEKRNELEKERLENFRRKWTDHAVQCCKEEYGGALEVLDGYLAEYTKRVKETLSLGLDLMAEEPPEPPLDQDKQKLEELCRKLGILEE